MTRDEIVAFYESVSSFAVPTREETERVNALSPRDRGKLLDYILERAIASGVSDKTPDQIMKEAREKAFARLAVE